MSRLPILHIGMVKCASTSLQVQLFARHPELHHIGSPYRDRAVARVTQEVVERDVLDDDDPAWRAVVDDEREKANGRTLAWSDEMFTMCDGANRLLVAERLHRLLGPARVVLVIRRQDDWLASRYTHQYLKPIPETRLRFEDWLFVHWNRPPHLLRTHADYDAIARGYERVFGREHVAVMPLEQLQADREGFVRTLCGFLEIDAEAALPLLAERSLELRGSRLGYVRRRLGLAPGIAFSSLLPAPLYDAVTRLGGGRMEPAYPDEWRRRIAEHYRQGNARLAERHSLPLADLGYPA